MEDDPGPISVSGEALRVLVVEHDADDARRAVTALEQDGFAVHAEVAATPEEFRRRLAASPPDIVLADYNLPGWTGLQALELLRAAGLDTPLILVTATMGDERAVESLRLGVTDYVIKQNLARLPQAVRRALAEQRAIRDRLASEALIQQLTLAVDQSPASVIVTDTQGTIEYVNRRFCESTGFSKEEVLGRTPRILQSGETPLEVYRDLWGTLRRGEVWRGELRNRLKSGALCWHQVVISPVRNSGGAVTHFLSTQEDVTELRQAERALRERETLYRTLTETSFDGIGRSQEGRLVEVNRGFAEMFGYEVEECIGRPVLEFVAEESRDEVSRRLNQGIDGRYDFVGRRKDGRRIRVEATVRQHSTGGRPERLTALRDVTATRQLEEQYRQAQKMEAVGRLAGGVAHDFNNLLTVIISYSELLAADLGKEDARAEDLQEVLRAAKAAAGLTRQLLAFSRQQVIEPQVLTLQQVVEGSEKMLRRLIGEDIQLETVFAPERFLVRMDPGQLEQVIMNLVVNSRDAMPTGGRITIETAAVELDESYAQSHWPTPPGGYAMLAISDTGVGMDEATRNLIFEPFFTTKGLGKGTGLGLSTVYGIVKQSGGFIWVYSEPGQGTTFRIYLPRVGEEELREPAPQRGPARTIAGTETILLVEDAAAVREVAAAILTRQGYRVLTAPNAAAAVELAAGHQGPIHLLVTDVVMPGGSGSELAKQLLQTRPGARILYISGYTADAVVRHGIIESGRPYLQKPFSPEGLAQKVRQVLDRG